MQKLESAQSNVRCASALGLLLVCFACSEGTKPRFSDENRAKEPAASQQATSDAIRGGVASKARSLLIAGSMSVREFGGSPYALPVVLLPGSVLPKAVFARDEGRQVWLGVYNFDSARVETERIEPAPLLDLGSARFARAVDLDSDGLDDVVGIWVASDGSGPESPQARVATWSSASLRQLQEWRLFEGSDEYPYVSILPTDGNQRACECLTLAVEPSKGEHRQQQTIFRFDLRTGAMDSLLTGTRRLAWPTPLKDETGRTNRLLCAVSISGGAFLQAIDLSSGDVLWTASSRESMLMGAIQLIHPGADIDRRGVTDAILQMRTESGASRLICVSGEDGAVIWAASGKFMLELAIQAAGDFNLDGVGDYFAVQRAEGEPRDFDPLVLVCGKTGGVLQTLSKGVIGANSASYSAARTDEANSWLLVGELRDRFTLVRFSAK